MTHPHDVLIVGGGLVGSSLAIALDRLGLDVGLVEATPAGSPPTVFDQRNLSFAAATVNALGVLGVMAKLRSPPGPIRRVHVSRAGDFGRVQLDAADYGRTAFGQVVVARDFGDALQARLDELTHLHRYRPARCIGVEPVQDGLRAVRLATESGEQRVHAKLVVGADGSNSAVRELLHIDTDAHDFLQTLFVARIRASRPPDGTAWERFGEHGPTALLPRGDRHYGGIHCVARAEAEAVAALDDAGWLARLQRAAGWRAGRFIATGERSAYPLVQVLANNLIAERVVLLGNAAQTLHPIGAQGFNLGLRDALTLAELIEHDRSDAGSGALLADYVARRRVDREHIIGFSSGLARLTGNPAPLLRPLRSLGLFAASQAAPLQSMLVGGAMGFRGYVPQLCRGVA
ncbi:TPA: 2-octaprenyl-6-methoxyphenyl hydroxylase [Xanthomonas vasicola pv. zeae]|uniref:2-octaprenyl-6-methoxyphenyl hydroxylase n=1 Tax=Xanthomonas vasicola TaxID=56459 RepID=UPI00034C9262|nr:2-octaprenyl-6-methoxyphenyl hydroxylase [Xanthomonas vasicola]KEZ98111.1 2-octaprenyl-6-methoxyphenyl hydroxylase [Xanthomonas vasicola pv. vasculorum NCPPB 895]MBV7304542.1 2-octaprenyl-6-methoxyphenyl hydroxylase [Xanthomonas vasicola pv. vasculorum]MDO6934651.1 2-octaprenyl-6-methoxyphenyl hydroxylase [Xanthomonas vasicola]MDO6938502.1 2-octaprenyl-6-methoxyphenyl hydroxylase [Xanthomonas vasicola]HHZ24449.1 2-octaprenyl-6-methoxyphenyl hydroxylase [Xanthomonas vasicola pv. zeae]